MSSDAPKISLDSLPDLPLSAPSLTPRSMYACLSSGVTLEDLVYHPLEFYAESGLAPRLVQLRFDFFEAKRKDLLSIVKQKREEILGNSFEYPPEVLLGDVKTEKDLMEARVKKDPASSPRKILTTHSDWFTKILALEMANAEKVARDTFYLQQADEHKEEEIRQAAIRMKELNDKRKAEEEEKQREEEARMELEKKEASEEYARKLKEQERLMEEERKKRFAVMEKQQENRRQQLERERKKLEREKALFDLKQQKLMELKRKSDETERIRRKLEKEKTDAIAAIIEKEKSRRTQAEVNNQKIKDYKLRMKQLREEQDRERTRRMNELHEKQAEATAKRQLEVLIKRKFIKDENRRKCTERRNQIVKKENATNQRLDEFHQKRMEFLQFKHELENLKDKNKQMNVERERRAKEFKRNQTAQEVISKSKRSNAFSMYRNQQATARRVRNHEEQRAREFVKSTLMDMRIKSNIDVGKMKVIVEGILQGKKVKDVIEALDHGEGLAKPVDPVVVVPSEPVKEPVGTAGQFTRAVPDEI
jgi:hypothetical protein